jgi:hypothetical protein
MNQDFPADIKQFIGDNISSIAQLELLLLLRSDPDRAWTAAEAGAALYSPAEVTALQLADLHARWLVAPAEANRYIYHPQSDELNEFVSRLAELYRTRRVAVVTAVYSKPVDTIRTFADAFRFRKDKEP